MSWSGFRPSDDACMYNYLVPSNMMAVVALECLAGLPLGDAALAVQALELARTIRAGIETHGKVRHPRFGEIYAFEVDGLGNANLMDDANVPSLLAMPFMGYCAKDDPVYLATRAFVLSGENPYFYEGKSATGIGSPHTPQDYIWPISLCIQGLTSNSRQEQLELLEMLMATDAGTGLMHEGFHKDDPAQFTRPWFAWANSMFAELVIEGGALLVFLPCACPCSPRSLSVLACCCCSVLFFGVLLGTGGAGSSMGFGLGGGICWLCVPSLRWFSGWVVFCGGLFRFWHGCCFYWTQRGRR